MRFSNALDIQPGLTALIGSGGKSTLMERLAAELAPWGRILLCTSTRIYPPKELFTLCDQNEAAVRGALSAFGIVCVGTPIEQGKLAPSTLPYEMLCKLADYVLVEADGAHRLPLKAHAAYEPVIPPESGQTICVLGLSGLGQSIAQAAHRPALYARLAGVGEDETATPPLAARVLQAEGLGTRYFLNQAEGAERTQCGRELAALLNKPTVIGSLQEDWIC